MPLEGAPVQHPACGLADGGRVGEDPLHPLVRREILALDDADGGELTGEFRVVARRRLILDVLVDHFEEAEIARRDRVVRLAAALDEGRLRNRRLTGQLHAALERRRDAGAERPRRIGVDLQVRLDVVDGGFRIVVDEVGPRRVQHVVGLGVRDEIAALRQRPVIVRTDDQILAAQPAVRTGAADVDDPGKPHVVDGPDRVGRLFDHHRTVRQVDPAEVVHRVGVCGQIERTGVHQLGEDDDVVVLGADAGGALQERQRRGAAKTVVVDVQRVAEVERVGHLTRRLGARRAVLEVERADRRLDAVGRAERVDGVLADFGPDRRGHHEGRGDASGEQFCDRAVHVVLLAR